MSAPLAAARVAAVPDAAHSLVMLHGIYGRGRNWQGIARALTAARPDYACWLVDLPHHGDSPSGTHGISVTGLAADVLAWQVQSAVAPTAVLGHSYGGKVALAMALAGTPPLQTWLIDSTPETKDPGGSAWDMLGVIRRLPAEFPSRESAIDALTGAGVALPVAQWMSTNLVRAEGAEDTAAWRWRLDFSVMEALLHSFFTTDMWPAIGHASAGHEVHVVKASESSAISASAAERFAQSGPFVHLHNRPGGHWIHAERPQTVVDLLVEYLP